MPRWKEQRTKLVAPVLAIRHGVVAKVELNLDDLVDGIVFDLAELRILRDLNSLFRVHLDALLAQVLGTEQRAHVLGPKGRSLVV